MRQDNWTGYSGGIRSNGIKSPYVYFFQVYGTFNDNLEFYAHTYAAIKSKCVALLFTYNKSQYVLTFYRMHTERINSLLNQK